MSIYQNSQKSDLVKELSLNSPRKSKILKTKFAAKKVILNKSPPLPKIFLKLS